MGMSDGMVKEAMGCKEGWLGRSKNKKILRGVKGVKGGME